MSRNDWPDVMEPSSPEDGSNFRRSLQIDMKGLVGDAVGNMSISPGSRDVVLAARKGLFIIDLEAPLNVPRFLPQGGTWDVADVQWNPHLTRSEYIVSTSSEKLLIWNLLMVGKTSIQHVLRSHYRAITDINWHTTDPDVVVSTGIDSWLWAWDLRTTQKPVMGLCAFGSGGTQVKWNRQDGNYLASSHLKEVLIWDRRKGSVPVSRIKAHNAKIYGIDWAHERRNEIVTCSLDKTIKIWNTQTSEPKIIIRTRYPVWRARDLPFGQGVLSLPQRGETALELFAHEDPRTPIETFEGHTDVVKEFVWRKGGQDGSEFQLITWSKDKTLRFWPMDIEVMQRAGTTPTPQSVAALARQTQLKMSFSSPPVDTGLPPALSAPVGHRSILAEIRAPFPLQAAKTNAVAYHAKAITRSPEEELSLRPSITRSRPVPIAHRKGGTMTRGHVGGRSAQINTFAWLSSVKVGGKREGSSGPGSGGESGTVSRLGSMSRPPSLPARSASQTLSGMQRSSDTRDSREDDHRDGEAGQSLQDEITSVIGKLTTSKVKLEKADLTKTRTCTFGLHGPWGDSTSVFIRISFTFPRDYPQAAYPLGIPMVDLERNPLISMNNRAFILRRLRAIRERQRPCLEKCLRFLLFDDDNADTGRHIGSDSESSSEDEAPAASRKYRDLTYSLLRSDKNLAEPRTSQGVFGVNGELVCFFRAPPRIVRNLMREISVSPSFASHDQETSPRLFQSPALVSDAIRRLSVAAHDRETEDMEVKKADDTNNILRIMTNLFIFSENKPMRMPENSRSIEDMPANYSLVSARRSTVFIKKTPALVGIDTTLAGEYEFIAGDPADLCKKNAEVARLRCRIDHERIFKLLEPVFANASRFAMDLDELSATLSDNRGSLATRLVDKLYKELAASKDIQMLAMLSVLLLWASSLQSQPGAIIAENRPLYSGTISSQKISVPDHGRSGFEAIPNNSLSPLLAQKSPSPTHQPAAPPFSSPSSSKGSWSNLFNASTMRQFVAGSKSGVIPVPVASKLQRGFSSPSQGCGREFVPPTSPTTKSWSEATNVSNMMSAVTFSSAGHLRRPTFSQVLSNRPTPTEKKKVVLNLTKAPHHPRSLQAQLYCQLLCHALVYAEMLLAWQLPEKRNELLKLIERELRLLNPAIIENTLVLDQIGQAREDKVDGAASSACPVHASLARCTVCRLPVKGLSFTCARCLHVTHVPCWEGRRDISCATGCGCPCTNAPKNDRLLADALSLSPLQMASASIT